MMMMHKQQQQQQQDRDSRVGLQLAVDDESPRDIHWAAESIDVEIKRELLL